MQGAALLLRVILRGHSASAPTAPLQPPTTHDLKPIQADFTFQILWVVNDEVPVPNHGKVHCQVADVHPIVEVLQGKIQNEMLGEMTLTDKEGFF